eukprot:342938_1
MMVQLLLTNGLERLLIMTILSTLIFNPANAYFTGPSQLNWATAHSYCQSEGSNLATIQTSNDNELAASACNGGQKCWIGLHIADGNGFTWTWDDGVAQFGSYPKLGFRDIWGKYPDTGNYPWHVSQPDNGDIGREYCVFLYENSNLWGDSNCDAALMIPLCDGNLVQTQQLSCPLGTEQIAPINADIGGCGLLDCNSRYNYQNIDECKKACDSRADCKSFTWNPLDGDRSHPGYTVCTLYNSDIPNQIWGPNQIMCKPTAKAISWNGNDINVGGWALFEGAGKWYECPEGYVVGGFWRNDCQLLHCLEEMKCIKPSTPSTVSQNCITVDISSLTSGSSTFECPSGYFVRGIWSDDNNFDGYMNLWKKLKCCKYDRNVLSYSMSQGEQNWWACFDGSVKQWCNVDDMKYITGFFKNAGGEIYNLEIAKTRELYLKPTYYQIDCYNDDPIRALRNGPFDGQYTIESCAKLCVNYQYFALEAGNQCFCDGNYDHAAMYGLSDSCSVSQVGGHWTFNLFKNTYSSNGCADASSGRVVIKDKIYACPGIYTSGGIYGEEADRLCATGYSVCESAKSAATYGLTVDMCTNNVAINNNEFFATKQSSGGGGNCNTDGYDDIWGCAKSGTIPNKDPDCNGILNSWIGNSNWNGWILPTGNTANEANDYILTDSESGGVLCCVDFAAPVLLYTFYDIQAVISNGESIFDLTLRGNAQLENGKLICDSVGDYAFVAIPAANSHSHSMEIVAKTSEPNKEGIVVSIYGYQIHLRDHAASTKEIQYIHLVITYDESTNKIQIYENGIPDTEPATHTSVLTSDIILCQANSVDGIDGFTGSIRYFAVYDYVLSSDQIEKMYESYYISKPSEQVPRAHCDYYAEGPLQVTKQHSIGSVRIDQQIEIEFDYIVASNCEVSECNLLRITTQTDSTVNVPGIYVTNDGQWRIKYSNDIEGQSAFFEIANEVVNAIVDGNRHHFYISLTENKKIVAIDDIIYYQEDGNFVNTYYHNEYHLYLSDEHSISTSLDTILSNLCVATTHSDHRNAQVLVVGGRDVDWWVYPYVVAIRTSDGICTGSIISKRNTHGKGVILTAAHCEATRGTVEIGCSDMNSASCDSYNIDKWIPYDFYSKKKTVIKSGVIDSVWSFFSIMWKCAGGFGSVWDDVKGIFITVEKECGDTEKTYTSINDIAVIHLDREITTPKSMAIRVAQKDEAHPARHIVGYGKDNVGHLRMAEVSNIECKNFNAWHTVMCIEGIDGNACGGDSGGPYVTENDDQIGVHTGKIDGSDRCTPTSVKRGTDVRQYTNWINRVMNKSD